MPSKQLILVNSMKRHLKSSFNRVKYGDCVIAFSDTALVGKCNLSTIYFERTAEGLFLHSQDNLDASESGHVQLKVEDLRVGIVLNKLAKLIDNCRGRLLAV